MKPINVVEHCVSVELNLAKCKVPAYPFTNHSPHKGTYDTYHEVARWWARTY